MIFWPLEQNAMFLVAWELIKEVFIKQFMYARSLELDRNLIV